MFVISLVKSSLLTAPIIVVLLLHAKFRSKSYNPNVRLAIWLTLGVTMLFPASLSRFFHSLFSMGSQRNLFTTDYSAVAMAFREIEEIATLNNLANVQSTGSLKGLNIYTILAIAYIVISVAVMFYRLTFHALYMSNLKRWSTKITDEETLLELKKLKLTYNISREISLISSEQVSSPMLIGILRPTIALPKRELSSVEMSYVLSHELAHYKRKDLWIQLFSLIITSVYWINPLVYLMQRGIETDTELGCDTKVVTSLTQKEKQLYCYTILDFWSEEKRILSTGFSSKNSTQRRMESILSKEKKKKGLLIITVIILLSLIMGACMYGGEPTPKQEPITPLPTGDLTEDNLDSGSDYTQAVEPSVDLGDNLEELREIQRGMEEEISSVYGKLYLSVNDTKETPSLQMGWPVPEYYIISSAYGWRFDGSDYHTGTDITGKGINGKDVVSAADGEVVFTNSSFSPGAGYGIYLIVDHGNGITSLYSQLSGISVVVGQEVKLGEKLGAVGSTGFSTGPHLHFEVRVNGLTVDPYDFLTEEAPQN